MGESAEPEELRDDTHEFDEHERRASTGDRHLAARTLPRGCGGGGRCDGVDVCSSRVCVLAESFEDGYAAW